MKPRFEYFYPCQLLKPFVKQYYLFEGPNTNLANYVPTWLKSILAIQFGASISADFNNKGYETVKAASLNGVTTSPYLLKATGDIVRFFVVEFTPIGMYLLFRENNEQFVNESIDVLDVVSSTKKLALAEALEEHHDMVRKVQRVEEFLVQLIPNDKEMYSIRAVRDSLQMIDKSKGQILMREISDELKLSERHIRRLFREVTGLSPKQYSRVTRFTEHFNDVIDGENKFSQLVTDLDYYDQAHFIKEFKYFTNFSPSKVPKEQFAFARLFT